MHIVMRERTPLHEVSQYVLSSTLGVTYPTVWKAFRREPVSAKFVASVLMRYPRLSFEEMFEVVRVPPAVVSTHPRSHRASLLPTPVSKTEPAVPPTPKVETRAQVPFPADYGAALVLSRRSQDPLAELHAVDYTEDGTDATPVPHVEVSNPSGWVCRFFKDGSVQLNTDQRSALSPLLSLYGMTEAPVDGFIR